MNDQYVWLIWSLAFLIPWLIMYRISPTYRSIMLKASLFTMLFGLTEPLFVPEYWSPPSLFNLALKTGFDIESLIFCFGIGGIGAVAYNVITRQKLQPVPLTARLAKMHNHHLLAITTPFIVFPILMLWNWNPIYPAITAMIAGGIANSLCRPDIALKSVWGSVLFLIYYAIFIFGLEVIAPGYIERVWNLDALNGLFIIGIPIEELLFAASFGYYWTGIYEHLTWKQPSLS
ncbi:MAG: lycopene cyclase domain-containing protein [Gammaproteobacteria bacterium]|nr:lycopene cyclase domain-containing protein [Gammaproteobacteria bacterium]